MSTESHQWGRVADDGTVYVRTSEGERVVGIWQAGSPDEALAFFTRRYDSLATEVSLLEKRITTTDLAPGQAKATITRLHAAIAEAKAVGDLEGLKRRLDALTERADQRQQEHKAARDRARVEAIEVKERIVAEAEKLAAEATHWKSSGERLKELLDEWKAAPHGDRQAEAALWKRMSAARSAFAKRRKGYFAALEEEREGVRERKQELVRRAEELSSLDRLGRDRGRLSRADGVVEGGGPRRPGRGRRAVEAVQGRAEHLLRCPVRRDVG